MGRDGDILGDPERQAGQHHRFVQLGTDDCSLERVDVGDGEERARGVGPDAARQHPRIVEAGQLGDVQAPRGRDDGELAVAVLPAARTRGSLVDGAPPSTLGKLRCFDRGGRNVEHAGGIAGDDRQVRTLAEDVLQSLDPGVDRVPDFDALTIEVFHFARLPVDGGDRLP